MNPSVTRDQLIINWYKRSQKQKTTKITVFDQFIYLWFAFNSWGTSKSQKDKDIEMLQWIKENSKLPEIHTKLIAYDDDFTDTVLSLGKFSVEDMRPNHRGTYVKIKSIHNFSQVLDVIYKVRCNLFHSQKSIVDENDYELVEISYLILSKIFSHVINDLQ